mmetsp:Transcript_9306/g.8371  ORF Transcript_9306/g.8371 Transcript_9306/m.8371 type:complete len:87 (+) Transcript_9306:3-263(+)
MEHDDSFQFNQELMDLGDRYEILKELDDRWVNHHIGHRKQSKGRDQGHKAKKRKKKLAYFERKHDKKMNKRMKRKFYKRYALSLQY